MASMTGLANTAMISALRRAEEPEQQPRAEVQTGIEEVFFYRTACKRWTIPHSNTFRECIPIIVGVPLKCVHTSAFK